MSRSVEQPRKRPPRPGEGRPSKYTPFKGQIISQAIANGDNFETLAKEFGVNPDTLYEWEHSQPEFSELMVRARKIKAEHFSEQVVEIADDHSGDFIEVTPGKVIPNHAKVQRDRLRCDMRWRLMERWNPERFGQSQRMELTGAGGGPIVIQQLALIVTQRLAAERLSAQADPQTIENTDNRSSQPAASLTPSHLLPRKP